MNVYKLNIYFDGSSQTVYEWGSNDIDRIRFDLPD